MGLAFGGACFVVIASIRAADYFVYGRVVHGISRHLPGGEGLEVLYQAIYIGLSGGAMIWFGMRKANSGTSQGSNITGEARNDSDATVTRSEPSAPDPSAGNNM